MSIELHIEELVLHGFAPGDRHAIGHAVETELTRMLVERGLPPTFASDAEIDSIRGGSFTATPGSSPPTIGVQIARSIMTGLNS